MKRETLDAVVAARAAGRAIVLATRRSDGLDRLIDPREGDDALALAARAAARADASGPVEVDGEAWMLTVFNPPLHLSIVGAVHIGQSLARMASVAGWRVTVIDPRGAFATQERFPGVALSTEWPDAGLAAAGLNARTAVVTLTHDPKLDDPALEAALRSDAFYVGALGSRKTHGVRLDRLRARGFDEPALARIRGPVGLDIEARLPPEIAVSIMAQIVAVLRGAEA